jgi:hypothetical protein
VCYSLEQGENVKNFAREFGKYIIESEKISYIVAGFISAVASALGHESIFTLLQYSLLMTGILALFFVALTSIQNMNFIRAFNFSVFTMPSEVSMLLGKWIFLIWVFATLDVIVKLITHHPWM